VAEAQILLVCADYWPDVSIV